MHEMSIAQDILQIVEAERRKHGFERVAVIHVRAGALSGVDEESLKFAFEVVREGTCAAEAQIRMETADRVLECRACGARVSADGGPAKCPKCGSVELSLRGAMGLDVVSLEVDCGG